jgi:hypothetical protein
MEKVNHVIIKLIVRYRYQQHPIAINRDYSMNSHLNDECLTGINKKGN